MRSGRFRRWRVMGFVLAAIAVAVGGCVRQPYVLPVAEQKTIDRAFMEYPSGFELKPYIVNLTAPTAMAFDPQGTLIIAESGVGNVGPRIFGIHPDGKRFDIYPAGRRIPLVDSGFKIYSPIGGMVVDQGRIYISHRDAKGRGMITAFGYDGAHTTVVADLPAQGEYSVTDIALSPSGRLFFGVGAATNSGVVGLDDWAMGWVNDHPQFCDLPWMDLKLLGYRFDTRNPRAGLFGGDDIAVTAPFQPFGTSNQTRIRRAPNEKPTAAIYSVNPAGGGLKVEAHGVRRPRGLAFNEDGNLYMTNNGMELRGTRPIKDDPDALLKVVSGTWYGWPDFSTDLYPISDARFQPGAEMIIKTGYPDISFLIDHETSGLIRPNRSTLLRATFLPLSGAAKMDFAPGDGPFKEFHGNVIVALSGDTAPFATGGRKLIGPIGYKVVRVDVDTHQVKDFIRNTQGAPASRLDHKPLAFERPIDVKFGPDGSLYILDFGELTMRSGRPHIKPGSGKIFRLVPVSPNGPPLEN